MTSPYRSRRVKLKNHTAGNNRHNKGVAHEDKAARLQKKHLGAQMGQKKKRAGDR